MSLQPASTSLFSQSLSSHLHIDNETCPWCEQDIPPEKLEEINGKIAAKEHEKAREITVRLEEQAKTKLELERQNSAAREAAAREEERKKGEAAAAVKLAEAERSRQEMQAGLQHQVEQAKAAQIAAEQTGATLLTQLRQLGIDSEAALTTAKAEAKSKEAEIRTQAHIAAQAAVAEKIAAIERARLQSEAALQARITEAEATKAAAEQKGVALQLQLEQLTKAKDAEVAKVKEEAAADVIRVRQEATEAAEALVRHKLEANEKAVIEAKTKALEAEGKLAALKAQYSESLNSLREVMEKAKDNAVNIEKANAFQENQKLSTRVNELQRALDKKTNEELGEGAEVNVFEALKAEFPDDRITRIQKGAPGGDILHVVTLHGRECGTIIYDSKNHKQFRSEHVAKLKADQLAAKAEHAILSTHKFPQGTSQLHMQDGILLANPARVLLIATLLRHHLLLVHTLRLSGIERESKTAVLYEYITSERCTQLLGRVDARADELLDQQDKEIKWHENNWRKQGEAIRAIQKAKADLGNEIGLIIGTAADGGPELEIIELRPILPRPRTAK
jgi:hypothetical protein